MVPITKVREAAKEAGEYTAKDIILYFYKRPTKKNQLEITKKLDYLRKIGEANSVRKTGRTVIYQYRGKVAKPAKKRAKETPQEMMTEFQRLKEQALESFSALLAYAEDMEAKLNAIHDASKLEDAS